MEVGVVWKNVLLMALSIGLFLSVNPAFSKNKKAKKAKAYQTSSVDKKATKGKDRKKKNSKKATDADYI